MSTNPPLAREPAGPDARTEEPAGDAGGHEPNEAVRNEGHNLLVLAWFHVMQRLAWIFKTESVIIPAYLDTIVGASPWRHTLRGFLPVLNRFGHSVPPLLYADRLNTAPLKKWQQFWFTLMMAGPFLALSAAWFLELHLGLWWFPALFLALYALFFAATGLSQLGFGTLQGKLIRPERRGRLMGFAGIVGSVFAVSAAWFLLPRLLVPDAEGRMDGFGSVFAVAGFGFVMAAMLLLPVRESPDADVPRSSRNRFVDAWNLFGEDPRFRGVAVVAMLYMTMQLIFPHYQFLGLAKVSPLERSRLIMVWVVVQNAGVGVISWVIGALADRSGNRLAVRCVAFGAVLPPIVAIGLTNGWLPGGTSAFWVVFLLLGINPVGMRTFSNYVLEFGPPEQHTRYLSTLKVCMAVPFLLSPFVGWLVGVIGFTPVFLGVSVAVFVAGCLTFVVHEPRHDPPAAP